MSLETWKQAFYPFPADECDESDAVAHSRLKWEGLRPDALAEHEMEVIPGGIHDEAWKYLEIASSSCALCECHFDDSKCKDDPYIEPEDHTCGTCPLYLARGNVACDDNRTDETVSPFHYWQQNANPEPMIHWLKQAQAWEDANDPKPTVRVRVHEGPKPEDEALELFQQALDQPGAVAILDTTTDPGMLTVGWGVPPITSHAGGTTPVPDARLRAKPAAKPPIGGLHHEGPANPSPREGD